jgi:acyl-coenzyme A synthetase/AMP-(fatty) acid ligase
VAVLPSHKVPRYVGFTDEPLPRNASAKIHRLEVRNNHNFQELAP